MSPIIKIKPGVKLDQLKVPALLAAFTAAGVLAGYNVECTITSGNDGTHRPDSLHPRGMAIDVRTRDLTHAHRREIRDKIAAALGSNYDVILETDHLHIEYDPRPDDR